MANPSPPPSPTHRRRSSFADIFNPRSVPQASSSPSAAATPSLPAPQHNRTSSTTTVGLGAGSSTQASPFTAFAKQRRASVATSSGSGSPDFKNSFADEAAVIEEGDAPNVPVNPPSSPFARRVSFGAQALRDVKQSGSFAGSGGGGRRPSSSLFALNENTTPSGSSASSGSSETATTRGEGFSWSEALRDKTKRSPSFSATTNPFASNAARGRATSVATSEPPKEMPKAAPVAPKMQKPDHLGERMLRGEFMMD